MVVNLLLIIGSIGLLFLVPSKASAQKSCDQILQECLRDAEKVYRDSMASCSEEALKLLCERYKGKERAACLENIEIHQKSCRQDLKFDYQKSNESCYHSYKKCRKGDIFGRIYMSISYISDLCESPFITGNASFTILGFWKFRPKESNEYIRNYRPENLQMMALLQERAIEHNEDCPALVPHHHDCPTLLWYFQGGGASVLTVEQNVDYQQNPLGRFVLHDLPKPSKFAPKDIAKLVGPFYQVGSLGTMVTIEGKKRAGDRPPKCLKYIPAIYKVRFGKFLISDNIKTGGEMSGSESWESCGNDAIEMGDDESGNPIATISFEIEKDKISVSEGESPIKWPGKHEGECRSNLKGRVRVQWKFNMIK